MAAAKRSVWRWVGLGLPILAIAGLALTAQLWLRPVLLFLRVYSEEIQGLEAAMQLVLLLAGGALMMGYRYFRAPQRDEGLPKPDRSEAAITSGEDEALFAVP